jgi:hypothetical protein
MCVTIHIIFNKQALIRMEYLFSGRSERSADNTQQQKTAAMVA